MKYLFPTILLCSILLFSCSGGCDTSSPESAASCACESSQKLKAAIENGDEDEISELEEADDELGKEIMLRIENGDYTMMEYFQAVMNENCD